MKKKDHTNLVYKFSTISVTPEEIRYVRPQVAPNELGQGGSTARQVLTKFCISYWYVGPNMLEEWMPTIFCLHVLKFRVWSRKGCPEARHVTCSPDPHYFGGPGQFCRTI